MEQKVQNQKFKGGGDPANQKFKGGGDPADKCRCKSSLLNKKRRTKSGGDLQTSVSAKRSLQNNNVEQKEQNKCRTKSADEKLGDKIIQRWWNPADKCKCKKVIVEQKCTTKNVEPNCGGDPPDKCKCKNVTAKQ